MFAEDLMEEIYDSAESTEQDDSGSDSISWIAWFCSLNGHDYFCEIPEDYIEDEFNLTGLSSIVPFYKEALQMILDLEADDEELLQEADVEASAELLYGLIHQRYILTRQGQNAMLEKYETSVFGHCPRYFCYDTSLLPCGTSDQVGVDTVRLYCPSCRDLYSPTYMRHLTIDGAFFGTTFAHLFLMVFPDLDITPAPGRVYEQRIFGFKINEKSTAGPRMRWLRLQFDQNGLEITTARPDAKTAPASGEPQRSSFFEDDKTSAADVNGRTGMEEEGGGGENNNKEKY